MTKIAVIRRNGLGDLLCTLPLLLYLQNHDPTIELTLFVDERNSSLIPFLPNFGEVVILPKKGNKYLNLLKFGLRFRSRSFDVAISAKTSPMKLMNVFLFSLGAKKRIAYVDTKWHRHLINNPIPYLHTTQKRHQALKALQLVAPDLDHVPEQFYPRLQIPQPLKMLYSHPFETNHPRLLISASTTRAGSRLESSRYAALVNRLSESGPIEVIVVSQSGDRSRAQEIVKDLTIPYTLHFPRNFDEFMVLLDLADFYFVGDGGIAHIGAALGKKEVVLYGETDPAEWSPLGKGIETFYDPIHVNHLSDEKILEALKRKRTEVLSGRENQ